jgi:hypothetical protein
MKTKRQASGPLGLAASLAKVTRAVFRRRGFTVAAVLTQWPAIVGDELARSSCPEKLSFPPGSGGEGTLHVRAADAIALELQHLAPQILERVNTYFGYRAVARLAIAQGPLPERRPRRRRPPRDLEPGEERALDDALTGTADEGLKAALRGLGRAVGANAPPARAEEEPNHRQP